MDVALAAALKHGAGAGAGTGTAAGRACVCAANVEALAVVAAVLARKRAVEHLDLLVELPLCQLVPRAIVDDEEGDPDVHEWPGGHDTQIAIHSMAPATRTCAAGQSPAPAGLC